MTILSERHLKTGGDPRTLADYAALRKEMSKLTHPARPDVNWHYAEKLSLSLFEHNGVELQTAAWYTLARAHLAGLDGLNEGLAMVTGLVTRHWDTLWPQPVPARAEILNALSQRLQRILRTLNLTHADLSQLAQAEENLNRLDEVVQRLDDMPDRQIDALRVQMRNAALRLENRGEIARNDNPAMTGANAPAAERSKPVKQLTEERVTQPEPLPEAVTDTPSPAKPWKPFAAGMLTMLALAGILTGGWLVMHKPDAVPENSSAALSPLAATEHQPPQSPEALIRQTEQQLAQLLQLKPDWALSEGDNLVQQTLSLWPEQGKPLAQQWQHHKAALTLAPENLTGWHQGMTQLEQLANRLNALDEKKGKYMTVSELKSAVFAIMQSLNRTVPAEEQLRQLSAISAGEASHAVRQRQVEQHLQQLIAAYATLKQTPAE